MRWCGLPGHQFFAPLPNMTDPDQYAVVGNPVAHSRSPEIHAAFARQVGHQIIYSRMLAPLDQFVATLDAFRVAGGCGVNVTVPFKREAYHYATEHTPRAAEAAAANTLRFEIASAEPRIIADNTDGVGLVRDIGINLGRTISKKRILLLGAGGAAHGVMGALRGEKPHSITIHNRTTDKAHELAGQFSSMTGGVAIDVVESRELAARQFDIVINATAAGLYNSLPLVPETVFADDCLAYDMVYGKATPFLALAAKAGATTADGLGMLVEQAAEAFYFWRGVRPQTGPVIAALRLPQS